MDYVMLTSNILSHIFSDNDIAVVLPYLSKEIKAIGLHTEKVLNYIEMINHLQQYKSNHFNFIFNNYEGYIVHQDDYTCLVNGSFILSTLDVKKKFFYSIFYKNNKITMMHTSIDDISTTLTKPFILASCNYQLDNDLTIKSINSSLIKMLHYDTTEDFINATNGKWINCIHKNDINNVKEAISSNIISLSLYNIEYRIRTKDGSYIWIYDQGEFVFDEYKEVIKQSYFTDISAIKNKELSSSVEKEKYKMALKDNSISILEYHIANDYMIIDVLEDSKKRVYEHYLDYIRSNKTTVFEEDKQKLVDFFTLKTTDPITYKEYSRTSGNYFVKTLESTIIYNSNNEPEIVLATASNITSNWKEQNNLKQRIQRDSLTNLYNLSAGKYLVDEYLLHNQYEDVAMIVLDIDHFKEVNDTYGHLIGNELLIALANYLVEHSKDNDITIRMGGDEFVVFIKNTNSHHITKQCDELLNNLTQLNIHNISITISLGVYVFSYPTTFDLAFEKADEALYNSKNTGRNRYTIIYKNQAD